MGTTRLEPGMVGSGGRRPSVGLGPRICPVCEVEFQPYRASQQTCSKRCYYRTPEQIAKSQLRERQPERMASRNARAKRDWPKRRDAERRRGLMKRYGITPERYDEMLAAQQGVCVICGDPPRPDGVHASARLHVDHDHTSGKIRGLLCGPCNSGLGLFRDHPGLLQKAIEYLNGI